MLPRRSKGWVTDIGGYRFGAEFSPVSIDAGPYLDRWILYLGFGCLRLHRFWRGDDNRAPHDHPADFWTFPLASYVEDVYHEDGLVGHRNVRAFRVHYRPATFRHIVVGRLDFWDTRPFWTIVWFAKRRREWGFWPFPKFFVHWKEWI
jgi:hypothetical protein